MSVENTPGSPSSDALARDNPFRPMWGLLAVLVGLTLVMGARTFFKAKEIVPWRTDVDAAVAEAERTGRPRLLYFSAVWCEPCQQMRHTTWADERVEKALRAYVPIKVDHDARMDLVQKYRVEALPTVLVVDPSGQVTKATVGGIGADEFLSWLSGAGFTGGAVR